MFADELKNAQPGEVEVVLGGEPRPEALLVVGSEARNLRLIYCDRPLSSRYPSLDDFQIKKDLVRA